MSYTLTDLGVLPGGKFSQAASIDKSGLVLGVADVRDGSQHAVIWQDGRIADISKPGLGGPNSAAFGMNRRGQVLGQAESSVPDPNNENFCAYGTGLRCLPFLYQNGFTMTLPTLGGPNATVGSINNRGEAVGVAENAVKDRACPAGKLANGTGPQALQFKPVAGDRGRARFARCPCCPAMGGYKVFEHKPEVPTA